MAGFGRGAAILISIIIGIIILPFLGIKGLFSIVIIGFIANYLTVHSQRSYKVGGVAGGIIGFIVFIYGFFVSPTLPDLPHISSHKMISLELGGSFTLILGFVILVVTCTAFGVIGGAIVQKVFKKKSETKKYEKRTKTGRHKKKTKSPKSFNDKPRRTLNRK